MPGPRPRPATGFGRPFTSGAERPRVYLAVERAPIMRLARSLDGRVWRAGQYGAVFRANQRIARAVQEGAVGNLATSIVRPAQRTGTLERAISDARAVYADGSRIVIGVGDFLDRAARHWRAVEQGAPGLQGRVIYGFWTNAPRFDRGRVAVEGPQRGVRTGRPLVLQWDTPPYNARQWFRWTIEHPTQAHWYFLNAWNQLGSSGYMERVYREEFAKVTGPNGRPLSLPSTFRAYFGRPVTGRDFRL